MANTPVHTVRLDDYRWDILNEWAGRYGWSASDAIRELIDQLAVAKMPHLSYVVLPRLDDDGHCHRFTLTRPDLKSLHPRDLNFIRRAFGLDELDRSEMPEGWNGDE